MNKRTLLVTAALLPFLALLAADLRAQSIEVTPAALAVKADIVAVGKVSSLVSRWNGDHSRILTSVTLSVDQYVKGGAPGQPLTIVVPGGEVDGVGELYSHMATFQQGESVLVFAEKDTRGNYRVSSGQQGKYTVRKDETTGQLTVGGTMTLQGMTALVQKAIVSQDQK
jgi:hypothetical protein